MSVATLPSWVLRFPDRPTSSTSSFKPDLNFVDHPSLLSKSSRPRPRPSPPILIDTGGYAHKSLGLKAASTADSFFATRAFISLIQNPRIFTPLLQHLEWQDFFALVNTCSDSRKLFRSPALKDAILSHYVPGYRACLQNRDLRRYQDVHVTLHDLKLLLLSQRVPLHQYPMHALSVLSTLLPDSEQESTSAKLAALAVAHSRFVLLFQSIVHSSSSPVLPEPREARWRSRRSNSGIRQLTFPAPLSITMRDRSNHSLSINVTPDKPASPSIDNCKGRRLSIFGRNGKVPPPPAHEPQTLKLYSGSWRRSLQRSAPASEEGWSKLDSKPARRFPSSDLSSESSLTTRSPDTRTFEAENVHIPSTGTASAPSLHDLKMAVLRSRAPILRVFMPCSVLSEDYVRKCEEQLMLAGLWQHLSAGDIICNLGYVPPAQDDGSGDLPGRTWLIYNGEAIIPFSPPEPPPLEEPLSLPSPFYYTHLLPPLVNPTFILALPPCDNVPELTLTHVSVGVPSPHSPSGHAMATKYMWTARVWRREDALGSGWRGEWVLEVEGTKEGKQTLLHCVSQDAATPRHWKVVREKSGGGVLWLKLLDSFY